MTGKRVKGLASTEVRCLYIFLLNSFSEGVISISIYFFTLKKSMRNNDPPSFVALIVSLW